MKAAGIFLIVISIPIGFFGPGGILLATILGITGVVLLLVGSKKKEEMELRYPCPFCSEKILKTAKLCPFCKSELPVVVEEQVELSETDKKKKLYEEKRIEFNNLALLKPQLNFTTEQIKERRKQVEKEMKVLREELYRLGIYV